MRDAPAWTAQDGAAPAPLSTAGGPLPKTDGPLRSTWIAPGALVNLRGRPDDAAFLQGCRSMLDMALPTEPCRTAAHQGRRVVWAGPDDWFVLHANGSPDTEVAGWRAALAGLHAAVTDVSSGYAVLRLAGAPVLEVLAQGCPLDLHPRAFGSGACAGTHFFKASVWLWQPTAEPVFELLVRRSFMGYVDLMLTRTTCECGRVADAMP